MKPQEIEDLSFKIIDKEAGDHGFDQEKWPIVRRMIHTSADFEYLNTVRFSKDVVSKGIGAIKSGCTIITDTNMARVGIRKKEIESFGGQVKCLIADKNISAISKEKGITRAQAAVDTAAADMKDGIYVVGNAPTALLRLIHLIRAKKVSPALVIGFPVGFVNAAESKDELMTLDYSYITNKGRKGGSNIAASIVNALAIMAFK
ncbi:MAG: precorrin-8X methylmutase [Desulfobacteraceae bacterium]|nr:precorrin-8X methylmutase [Desulfobacteraceae bacterium]